MVYNLCLISHLFSFHCVLRSSHTPAILVFLTYVKLLFGSCSLCTLFHFVLFIDCSFPSLRCHLQGDLKCQRKRPLTNEKEVSHRYPSLCSVCFLFRTYTVWTCVLLYNRMNDPLHAHWDISCLVEEIVFRSLLNIFRMEIIENDY